MSAIDNAIERFDKAVRTYSKRAARSLKEGRSDDEIETLTEILGPLPDSFVRWAKWCGGSREGVLPDSSAYIPDIRELLATAKRWAQHPIKERGSGVRIERGLYPILSNGDGSFWALWVGTSERVVFVDHGEVVEVGFIRGTPTLTEWVISVADEWEAIAQRVNLARASLRPEPMGWQRLELSIERKSRKKMLRALDAIADAPVRLQYRDLSIELRAGERAFESSEGRVLVVLDDELIEKVRDALGDSYTNGTFKVNDDLWIAIS